MPQVVPEVEEITITVDGGYTQSPSQVVDTQDGPRTNAPGLEFGVPHHFWQLKDRSASGCRLRAPAGDAAKVPPGTLIAIRDDETMRWSLVVVRRIKTRIGDRIDIGVEYVGQNPRGVTMTVDGVRGARAKEPMPDKSESLHGRLPSRKRQAAGDAVQDADHGDERGQRHALPHAALGHGRVHGSPEGADRGAGRLRLAALRSARAPFGRPVPHRTGSATSPPAKAPDRGQPPLPDVGAPTDWLVPQFGKRVESAA